MSTTKTTEVRLQTFTAPAALSNTAVHAAITLPASGTTTVTTAITNPVTPRTIRLKGNQATVEGLVVIINGTDVLGNVISEAVTMGVAFATATDSLNAFATVTSIVVPTQGGASDTISVGLGAKLGLDNYCNKFSFTGQAGITSFTYDTAIISKNTVLHATTLDGSTDLAVTYFPDSFALYGRIWG